MDALQQTFENLHTGYSIHRMTNRDKFIMEDFLYNEKYDQH